MPPGYHHNKEFKLPDTIGAGDFTKLRYWDLIETRANDNSKTKDSGFWRITEKGRDYVEDRIQVPKICMVFNRRARGFSTDLVGIRDALGKDFDYPELMGFLI